MPGEDMPVSKEDRMGPIPRPRDESRITKTPKSEWTPEMHKKAALAAGDLVVGPNGPENKAEIVHPGQIGQGVDRVDPVDRLMDTDYEGGSVEDAAVNPSDSTPSRTIDRPGYWTPPTQEQIDRAAESGFDLTQQGKYYPPGQNS